MNRIKSFNLTLIVAVTVIVTILNNCTSEYIENINGVCFESEVMPILQSNCTQSGCHNSIDRESGYDFSGYENIIKKGVIPGDYRNSEIYRVLIKPGGEEAMPPLPYKRLTDDQLQTIALWIEQGAQHTTDCATAGCDTSNITFSGSVKPVLTTYCTGCHSGSAPSGSIGLDTYEGTKISATNGSLLGSVQHAQGYSPMPQGSNKLSDCSISTIKKWIDLGAKND